jgi:hypothetical protein
MLPDETWSAKSLLVSIPGGCFIRRFPAVTLSVGDPTVQQKSPRRQDAKPGERPV